MKTLFCRNCGTEQEYVWISVNDELPELGLGVLVAIDTGSITVAYRSNKTSPGYSREYAWQLFGHRDDNFGITDANQITHWMPLPPLPAQC